MRRKIYPKLNTAKLQIWTNILEEYEKIYESFAISNNVTFQNFYIIAKSVITPKTMDFDELIRFLDKNFGEDLFPTFSYEDAVVITFIKLIYPGWICRQFPNDK